MTPRPFKVLAGCRALIFDGEGIVIDTERMWDDVQTEFLRRRGRTYDRALVKPQLTGRALVESSAVLQQIYGLDDDIEILTRERLELMAELLRTGASFVEGFLPFFGMVRQRYVTCLATSMDPTLFDAVDAALSLTPLFGGRVVTMRDVPRGKPAPDLFVAAAERARVRPELCVVLEDSPLGILAAHSAGMRVIAITTTYNRDDLTTADIVVDSYEALVRSF